LRVEQKARAGLVAASARELAMHHPYDDIAKKVGQGALSASGPTTVEHPISRSTQRADIRHDPDPARAAERARLGLLGRIAEILCLIEIFGHAPDGGEWRGCLSKHFAHWDAMRHKARADNKKRKAKGLPPEPFVKPMLWIVAVAFSEPMLRKLKVRTNASFPKGVYFHGDDLHRVGIVVASELPRDRSTLLVRIMAAGPLLPDAIADLAELPEDAFERGLVEGDLVDLERALGAKPSRTAEEEEIVAMVQGTFTQARKMGRDEGRTEGEAAARVRDVLTVLRVRGIIVSDADRERILAEEDPARLERWLERAVLATSIAEVMDAPSRAA
jgi:hypothetical protein